MSPDTKLKLAELSELTIDQLAAKYEKLLGEKCRSRNRRYVYRRVAWKMQADDEGGLSERAILQDLELADAIEYQIRSLPFNCRRVAQLLRSCTQVEIAIRLGWSKRKVSEAMAEIREHFANVEWGEINFFRDELCPNCIASTGGDDISKPTQFTREENVL